MILCAVVMIFSGYMGAVSVVTTVKWFWFLIGLGVFVPVLYTCESVPCMSLSFLNPAMPYSFQSTDLPVS